MKTSTTHQLRSLYLESDLNKAFFDVLARRKNDASKTTVPRIMTILPLTVRPSSREISRIMERLEELELGRYVPGRHNLPSRFEWSKSMLEVVRAATGSSPNPRLGVAVLTTDEPDIPLEAELVGKDEFNGPAAPSTAAEGLLPPATESGEGAILAHRFPLRPNLNARLDLPLDLTAIEAERLASFIRALPIIPQQAA